MYIVVVLYILISLVKCSDGTFACTNDGIFRNSDDNNAFWQCVDGRAYLKYCPVGLIWSQVKQQCIWNTTEPIAAVRALSSTIQAKSKSLFDLTMVCDLANPIAGFLVNKATGRVLDSNEKEEVYTLNYNGGGYQRWKFERQNDDSCKLQNLATSLVLDSNGNRMYTLGWNGGRYQRWKLYWDENNYFVLLNLATSRVLDSNFNGQVYPSIANGGDFQKWFFQRV